jgi:hypothetical protein
MVIVSLVYLLVFQRDVDCGLLVMPEWAVVLVRVTRLVEMVQVLPPWEVAAVLVLLLLGQVLPPLEVAAVLVWELLVLFQFECDG